MKSIDRGGGGGGGGFISLRTSPIIVRRPRAHKVDHSKFTFTSPSKKKILVAWVEYLPKSSDLFVCQCRSVPFGQTGEFFLSPSSCTSCYGNQVDACDQGFVSTMLWLKFQSDGYPSYVWGLCSSGKDAKVQLGWLVVVHDVPGPLACSIQRARSWEVSVAATRRSSFSETVLALFFQRPEVSIT